MATLKKANLFPAELESEMFNLVNGHSSLAKMTGATPIAFAGTDIFTFNFDNEVSIVGESGQKPAGDATVTPVQIRPFKVVYQSRVSDEFLYASEEKGIETLRHFAEGFARKLARGLDIMALHGLNPASATPATQLAGKSFDALVTQIVTYDASTIDQNIGTAAAYIDEPNGIVLGKTARAAIAALTANNAVKYPEFAWGATPETLGNMKVDTNSTVEFNSSNIRALVGDFNYFRWGYARELPIEVIRYGDPDGQGDLKRNNEVVIRSEAYIGFGILDASQFATVEVVQQSEQPQG